MGTSGVPREEVAGLVLEWLQREDFKDTAAAFAREAHVLLAKFSSVNRKTRDLGALLDGYMAMLQKKQQKQELKASLLRQYPHILPSSFKSLLTLLEDYEKMCSSPAAAASAAASAVERSSNGKQASVVAHLTGLGPPRPSVTTPPGVTALPLSPLTGTASASSSTTAPSLATQFFQQSSAAYAQWASMAGIPLKASAPSLPETTIRGRGRRPNPPRVQIPTSALPDLMPRPGAGGALAVLPTPLSTATKPTPPSTLPTTSSASISLKKQPSQVQPLPQPRVTAPSAGRAASSASVPASNRSSTTSPHPSPPSISISSPASVLPATSALTPSVTFSSASTLASASHQPAPLPVPIAASQPAPTHTQTPAPASSPSKRKQQTPRKRKLDTSPTAAMGSAAKMSRTASPTAAASSSVPLIAAEMGPSSGRAAGDSQEEQGELMLDDSFFELLLNSDLPEKLAEQINKNLLSEVEQQRREEEREEERRREAAAAEAAAQAEANLIPGKKIEEIVEAITHEPSFEALFAQWDSENLDDGEEVQPADAQYESIVDEGEEEEISSSEDEEDEKKDSSQTIVQEAISTPAPTTDSSRAADTNETQPNEHKKATTDGKGAETDGCSKSATCNEAASASASEHQEQAVVKLAKMDLEAFLNKIHGPK